MAPNLGPTGINSFKTLIVEDNAFFRQSFKDTLQTRFPLMTIEEIGNGNQVLQGVDSHSLRISSLWTSNYPEKTVSISPRK